MQQDKIGIFAKNHTAKLRLNPNILEGGLTGTGLFLAGFRDFSKLNRVITVSHGKARLRLFR